MNFWKPIALCSIAALGMTVAPQLASAANGGSFKGEGTVTGGACMGQQHMANAADHMRQARAELDHAEHNKDGWRDSAIKNIDQAIHDTDKGCSWAERH